MRRLGAAVMVAVGVVSMALGTLFLLGAQGQARRVVVAAVGLGLGAVLTGLGARLFKTLDRALPERVRAELLALARREGGEVSQAVVEATLSQGEPSRVETGWRVLDNLVREGQATRRVAEDRTLRFVFPGLQARMVVRRCRFCGAVLPLDRVITACPQCGGQVDTALEAVASHGPVEADPAGAGEARGERGELFRMDAQGPGDGDAPDR